MTGNINNPWYTPGRGFFEVDTSFKGRGFVEKLKKNPRYPPPKKKKKKPARRSKRSLKIQAENQARDQGGKFAKQGKSVPIAERSFFGKLRAFLDGSMERSIRAQARSEHNRKMKHVYGILPKKRKRRRRAS